MIQDLRLLPFHYTMFSNYSFIQCITIIFVLTNQTREIQIRADHGESMYEATILQKSK
jgi:hypothetical protein